MNLTKPEHPNDLGALCEALESVAIFKTASAARSHSLARPARKVGGRRSTPCAISIVEQSPGHNNTR